MRSWLFKPLIFYPLVLIAAAVLVLISFSPLSWPHPQAPAASAIHDGALVLQGEALGAPASGADQVVHVVRDFFGAVHGLRIAVLPEQAAPTPQDPGVRILLDREAAQMLEDKAVQVHIDYRPIPLTTASVLAVTLEGGRLLDWTSQPIDPEGGAVDFTLPAQTAVSALGLRAVQEDEEEHNFGVEIIRIRVTPLPS